VQLNRDFDYAAALGPGHAVDNQLRTFEHLGILDVKWWEEAKQNSIANRPKGASWYDALMQVERLAKATDPAGRRTSSALLTRAPAAMNRLADPYDQTQDLAMRARSYLQSNCASCHVFAGGGNAMFDLDGINAFGIAGVGGGQGVDARPMHHTFGIPDARIIAPGHPERSVMVSRVSRRGAGQMPQLGTNVVDERAVQLLAEWIRSLPDPDKKPAAAETPKKPEPAAPAKDKPAGSPPGVAAVR
jgi:mono/diheme cytochrome c family protein